MKRTNLVLREELLEEATRLSGEKTDSRTVERALEELVRRIKARRGAARIGSLGRRPPRDAPPVIQEVLQGFGEERAYRLAREAMLALPVVSQLRERSV